jgi:hypothetical protein
VQREARSARSRCAWKVDGFTVTDNGIGFDEANLDAFLTSDTQNKVDRGGKGIGRFVWLKAFDRAEIESHYRQNGGLVERTFAFTIDASDHVARTAQENSRGLKCVSDSGCEI